MLGFNSASMRFSCVINGHTVDMEISANCWFALQDVVKFLSEADLFDEVL